MEKDVTINFMQACDEGTEEVLLQQVYILLPYPYEAFRAHLFSTSARSSFCMGFAM